MRLLSAEVTRETANTKLGALTSLLPAVRFLVVLDDVLVTLYLEAVGERRSRSSHQHHGRHKGRRNQQTDALNHAISFPYHTYETEVYAG